MNFNVGLSGIASAQGALKVTQQNIANLSTDGYVRQKAVFEEIGVGSGKGVMAKVGAGVQIKDVMMVMDSVLQNNFNSQNSRVNYYNELESILYETETVLGDYTEGSLSNMLQSFFQSWEEFSKFPEESSYRFAMLGESNNLVSKINEMSSQLSRLESEASTSIDTYTNKINEITGMISVINQKINLSGENVPNELVNERIKLIEELSSYLEVDVAYDEANANIATVRSSGAFLVSGTSNFPLKTYTDNGVTFVGNGSTRVDLTLGKLGASVDAMNKYIASYRNTIETFTMDMASKFNEIHRDGFSMTGETGYDFFLGNTAKTISINPDLIADSSRIASSASSTTEGNVEIARKLGALIHVDYKEGMSYLGSISSFSMKMAQDLDTVQTQATVQAQVLSGMEIQMESLQGVNLEEEMSNLLMFQQAYQANAKTLNVSQKVTESVLEILR